MTVLTALEDLTNAYESARAHDGYGTDETRLAEIQCQIGLAVLDRLDRLIELLDRPAVIRVPGNLNMDQVAKVRQAWVGGGPVIIPGLEPIEVEEP